MSEGCPKCGEQYVVQRDIDGRTWRYVCACELKSKCFKGGHVATHVFCDTEGEALKYACDTHGVAEEDRSNPPPVRSVTPVAPRKPVVYTPPKIEMRVVFREPRVPDTTVITKKIVEEDIKSDTFKVVCTGCGHVHQFNRRKVSQGTEPQCFKVDCPKCGDGGYKMNQ